MTSKHLRRGAILAATILIVTLTLLSGFCLRGNPERTFLLPRHGAYGRPPSEVLTASNGFNNYLNPFRDRGPEMAAMEIIEAAKRGDCNGEIWSQVSLPPDSTQDEVRYTYSQKVKMCEDFASIRPSDFELVDYLYTPVKAYQLFSNRRFIGQRFALVYVEYQKTDRKWRITEFSSIDDGLLVSPK